MEIMAFAAGEEWEPSSSLYSFASSENTIVVYINLD